MFYSSKLLILFTIVKCTTFLDSVASDEFNCFTKLPVKRKWPPIDPESIKSQDTGEYDMRINPYLQKNARYSNTLLNYVNHFRKKCKKHHGGTCFFQVAWILYRCRANPTDFYPQPVSHVSILKDVRQAKPVYEAPINDPPLSIVRRPKVCEKFHDFVLVILSCPHCFSNRQRFRELYLKPNLWRGIKFAYVFVMGKPAMKEVQTYYFDEQKLTNIRNYPKGLDRDTVYSQMLVEETQYRDMLIGDFDHGYYADTWNYILFIRWASVFCNKKTPLFGLLHQRYVVVPYKFIRWLRSYPAKKKARLYGGHPYRNVRVNHNKKSRWGTSWAEMALARYPDYIHRKFTLLGHDIVQDSAIMSAWKKHFRIMSVYIGIVNRMVRARTENVHGIYTRLYNRRAARHAIIGDMRSADRYINWRNGRAK